MKRVLKALAILLAALIVVAGGYVAYVFIDYHRLPDNVEIARNDTDETLASDRPYSIMTWNVGFGAYSSDYGFFMDGGTESRARSKQAVYDNLGHCLSVMQAEAPDFLLIQELDTDSTRSYHVDEAALTLETLGVDGARAAFAQNYDSPYLFYPVTRPHGASRSGILTVSPVAIERASRRSLPVETGFMKLLDLDRCYSVSCLNTDDGKQLCLYNLHLSAYTSDGSIATEQLQMLTEDMRAEYERGNYCVAGGDFNKDLLGNSGEIFGVSGEAYTWAQPLEEGIIPEGLSLVSSLDPADPVPSCRNADGTYVPGQSFVLTVDGFIVSDNVEVQACRVIDDGFACSDHNPVKMTFTLKKE